MVFLMTLLLPDGSEIFIAVATSISTDSLTTVMIAVVVTVVIVTKIIMTVTIKLLFYVI